MCALCPRQFPWTNEIINQSADYPPGVNLTLWGDVLRKQISHRLLNDSSQDRVKRQKPPFVQVASQLTAGRIHFPGEIMLLNQRANLRFPPGDLFIKMSPHFVG